MQIVDTMLELLQQPLEVARKREMRDEGVQCADVVRDRPFTYSYNVPYIHPSMTIPVGPARCLQWKESITWQRAVSGDL